jgi:nucleoid-associated protein YgaU
MSTNESSARLDLTNAFRKAAGLPVPRESLGELKSKLTELKVEIRRVRAALQCKLDWLAAAVSKGGDSPIINGLRQMRDRDSQRCQDLHKLMEATKVKITALKTEEAAKTETFERHMAKLREMETRLKPRLEAAFKAAAAKKAEQAEAVAKAEQAAKAKAVVVKANQKRKVVEFYCDGPDGRELVMRAKVMRKSSRNNE